MVRAQLPGGPASERSFAFELLPHFYETVWFRCSVRGRAAGGRRGRCTSCACARSAAASRWCSRSARGWHARFTTRWRRASWASPRSWTPSPCACRTIRAPARSYLDLARKMARHSLTEARRSVMDLRASALEGQDLAAALQSGTRSGPRARTSSVSVDVSGPATSCRRIWSSTCCASRRRPSPMC